MERFVTNEQFNRLRLKAEFDETSHQNLLIDTYHRGLPRHYQTTISMQGTPPTDVKGWQTKALELETIERTIDGGLANPYGYTRFQSQGTRSTALPPGEPMDIGQSTKRDGRPAARRYLSRGQQDEYRKNSQCYECGQQGHVARNCERRTQCVQGAGRGQPSTQGRGGYSNNRRFPGRPQQRSFVREVEAEEEQYHVHEEGPDLIIEQEIHQYENRRTAEEDQ